MDGGGLTTSVLTAFSYNAETNFQSVSAKHIEAGHAAIATLCRLQQTGLFSTGQIST